MIQSRMALAGVLFAMGCGGETSIRIKVDLDEFSVPQEVDLIHVELTDKDNDVLGRNFTLQENETQPIVELMSGDRMPSRFSVVIFAFKGDQWVSESSPQTVSFVDGEVEKISVEIPRP